MMEQEKPWIDMTVTRRKRQPKAAEWSNRSSSQFVAVECESVEKAEAGRGGVSLETQRGPIELSWPLVMAITALGILWEKQTEPWMKEVQQDWARMIAVRQTKQAKAGK